MNYPIVRYFSPLGPLAQKAAIPDSKSRRILSHMYLYFICIPTRNDSICFLSLGSSPTPVRGLSRNEDVWEGKDQRQPSHLPLEQEILQ